MNRYLLPLLALAFIFTACGEPDRTEYRDNAVETVCAEAARCNNLNNLYGVNYTDIDHCLVGERNRFNEMWPEDRCGEGRIDPDQYDRCLTRAQLAACGNWADVLSAWSECHANNVCTN